MRYDTKVMLRKHLRYIIFTLLLALISYLLSGCANTKVFKVKAPEYPAMWEIKINNDGSLNKENTDKTVENITNLQELIDLLYQSPSFKKD